MNSDNVEKFIESLDSLSAFGYATLGANVIVVLAYAWLAVTGFKTMGAMSNRKHFSNKTMRTGMADTARMAVPWVVPKYLKDGRGWAVIYMGSLLTSFAATSFSILHVEYMIEMDYKSVGLEDSMKWFATHMVGIVASFSLFYGAAHGANTTD